MRWNTSIFGIILSLLLLSGHGVLFAQEQEEDDITFEMKLSKEKLGINERLRVEFAMNKDGDKFNPPAFDGFRVVMGPSHSISSSWINGKRSFSKSYYYILKPTVQGSFNIGQATIEIDGETYKIKDYNLSQTNHHSFVQKIERRDKVYLYKGSKNGIYSPQSMQKYLSAKRNKNL